MVKLDVPPEILMPPVAPVTPAREVAPLWFVVRLIVSILVIVGAVIPAPVIAAFSTSPSPEVASEMKAPDRLLPALIVSALAVRKVAAGVALAFAVVLRIALAAVSEKVLPATEPEEPPLDV